MHLSGVNLLDVVLTAETELLVEAFLVYFWVDFFANHTSGLLGIVEELKFTSESELKRLRQLVDSLHELLNFSLPASFLFSEHCLILCIGCCLITALGKLVNCAGTLTVINYSMYVGYRCFYHLAVNVASNNTQWIISLSNLQSNWAYMTANIQDFLPTEWICKFTLLDSKGHIVHPDQLLLLIVLYQHSKSFVWGIERDTLLLICEIPQLVAEHELFGAFWDFVVLIFFWADSFE